MEGRDEATFDSTEGHFGLWRGTLLRKGGELVASLDKRGWADALTKNRGNR